MKLSLSEQVWLDFELASAGSRSLAFGIDFLLRWSVVALIALGLLSLDGSAQFVFERIFNEVVQNQSQLFIAAIVLFSFLIEFTYPMYFDVCHQGVSPGKRIFGIRVVDQRGLPITARTSLLRTIFNPIDLLGFGLVAFISTLSSKHSQRIGDLAAGTLVIHDAHSVSSLRRQSGELSRPVLVPQTLYTTLEQFLQRSDQLLPDVREKISAELLNKLLQVIPSLQEDLEQQPAALDALQSLYPNAVPLKEGATRREGFHQWNELEKEFRDFETLLDSFAADKSPSAEAVYDFTERYQSICHRCSYLQTYFPKTNHSKWASALVRQGRQSIYGRRLSLLDESRQSFFKGVAHNFGRYLPYVQLSLAVFLGAIAFAAILTALNPNLSSLILNEATSEQLAEGRLWTEGIRGKSALSSSSIMTNNVKVTYMAFASGVSAGVLTFVLLFFNGALLGGMFVALTAYSGMAGKLFEFVVAHGVLELSIIVVAGGVGFYIGDALIHPGPYSRALAFKRRCIASIDLLIFNSLCLVLAGLVEGYVSPYPNISFEMKLGLGLLLGVLYWAYLLYPRIYPLPYILPPKAKFRG